MTEWLPFIAAFAAFFVSHSIPVRPPIKTKLVRFLGQRGFSLIYSAVSLGMLYLLIYAAARAPYVTLWDQMLWHRYVTLCGMLAMCLLLAISIGRPNPFSFGGWANHQFDPHNPGIVRLTRHPLLMVLALWAGLHLLPNGDLAHVILFGVFAGFALLGMTVVDRRRKRLMGADAWLNLAQQVSDAPLFQIPSSWWNLAFRVGLGVFGFIILLHLHGHILGVAATP